MKNAKLLITKEDVLKFLQTASAVHILGTSSATAFGWNFRSIGQNPSPPAKRGHCTQFQCVTGAGAQSAT